MAHPSDPTIYHPGLQALYLSGPVQRMNPHQFAALFVKEHPHVAEFMYRRFSVPLYTRPNCGRPRAIVINPNHRYVAGKFLWDVRCAVAHAWAEVKSRVNIFINGVKLDMQSLVPSLRAAPAYSVQVVPAIDGDIELPDADPIAAELEARRLAEQKRRSEQEAAAATKKDASRTVPLLRVCDAVADRVATRMTAISDRVNKQTPSSDRYTVMAPEQATFGAALQALNDPAIYRDLGFRDASDFWQNHMGARNTNALTNSVATEIGKQLRKMPRTLPGSDGLHALYKKTAIAGRLMSQWSDTIHHFLGQHAAARSTGIYRVQPDYSLVITDGNQRAISAVRQKPAVKLSESPFQRYAFSKRTENTTEVNLRRASDAAAVRALSTSPSVAPVAPVDAMPRIAVPGESMVDSCPGLEDFSAAPAPAVAAAVNSSVSAAPDSMPAGIPLTQIAADTNSLVSSSPDSMPAAVPLSKADNPLGLYESMPNVALLGEPVSIKSDPLLAAFARDVINSDEYSGVIVPSRDAMEDKVREALAAHMQESKDTAAMTKPYLLKRIHTSHSINALIGETPDPEVALKALNGGVWRLAVGADGRVHMVARNNTDRRPVQIHRIAERPEAVVIYTTLQAAQGQHGQVVKSMLPQ